MIDYIREYKKFSSSYYVSEGIRTTAGVMIPVLVAGYLGQLPTGIAIALGAMCVGLTDNTGPIHHRINGMVSAIILIFITTLLTGFTIGLPWLLAIYIGIMGFACSMIGVYGVRANNVGGAGLLIMVLSIDERYSSAQVIRNALLVSGGGIFYLVISLLIYRLRPFKLIQQALGDALISTGTYLRTRADFYQRNADFTKTYQALLDQQVQVHNKQSLVREMLFKTRDIVKESTYTSRIMMMIFLDSVDLFERIMTSQQDYKKLHEMVDDPNLLPAFGEFIRKLAIETESIGLALQKGIASKPDLQLSEDLYAIENLFLKARASTLGDNNIEGFISMRHILDGLKDLYRRIETLHRYTSFDKKIGNTITHKIQYDKFVSPSEFNAKLITNNFSIHSNIFRHSIRVSVALLAGFFISRILPFGHGYWILLTIGVILKPAYSLTKTRNIERLFGTFSGAVMGVLILWLIKDEHILLALMVAGMIIAYSMLRVKYLVSVIAMTAYILIAFHFLKPGDFTEVLRDRLIDTFVGSGIAFIATIAIPPKWEHEQILLLLKNAIEANANYFSFICKPFMGEPLSNLDYKLHRKEAFVQLANLSDAFQRMLNEPKRQQKKIQIIHQMVVSNHMLVSHIATLSAYRKMADIFASEKFRPIKEASIGHLKSAAELLSSPKPTFNLLNAEENFALREELKLLLDKRLKELASGSLETSTRQKLSGLKTISDQFEYINKISIELEKLSGKLVSG
ncbi:FUSC family protein [Flavihumibacter profundi]|uniref:FUSC family protein n=1 Tax=Flavihumibacter profundi TaxID=2716883 RepID=UPI001CC70B32|nr:FUSC family membrane protein [Flavihumibacter profundi]MBZ5857915.1 FUSC family protein [Flavihumibacter profundi]